MNEPLSRKGEEGGQIEKGAMLRTQFVLILFLTVIFFLNFIARIILSPLIPTIEKDVGISHGTAGSFFLLITTGYFISLVGSGFVSSRISHRLTIIVSTIAVGLVLLSTCLTKTAWGIGMTMFALGLATGIYLPSGIATITNLVKMFPQ